MLAMIISHQKLMALTVWVIYFTQCVDCITISKNCSFSIGQHSSDKQMKIPQEKQYRFRIQSS